MSLINENCLKKIEDAKLNAYDTFTAHCVLSSYIFLVDLAKEKNVSIDQLTENDILEPLLNKNK
jgi:hypothetical protein